MEVDELFSKLRPALGKRIDALWVEYQLNVRSRKDIEGLLNVLAMQYLGQRPGSIAPILVPPYADTARGTYELGLVQYGDKLINRFGLLETEMIQHVAIFGRTGSGKTNVTFLLLQQLAKHGKPFMVFDWKRNYRDLLAVPKFENLRVFTIGRAIVPFSFNPLAPPPGISQSAWAKKLVEIMCHVYFLGDGVAYLLQKAVDAMGENNFTIADLKTWLEAYKARGRQAQWMDSALRLVGTLCHGDTGAVFATNDNSQLARMLDQQVVFELDALDENDKTFFIESLLLWIHHYRLQEPTRETFKHALIIEEAHHVLLRRTEGREAIPDLILREIRELGEAVILIDQHPSLISIPALGNTHTTIALNLKHGRDLAALKDALQLSEAEASWLAALEVGTAIVKLQSRYDKPFLVRFPLAGVSKGVVNDEVLRKYLRTDSADSKPITPIPSVTEVIPPIPIVDNKSVVSEGEWKVLCDVIAFPSSSVSSRFRRLAVSPRVGGHIIDSLASAGYLSSHAIKTPSGQTRFLQLTPKAEELCRERGLDVPSFKKGGPEHEYWRAVAAEKLRENGWTVEIEGHVTPEHDADVVAMKNGYTVIFEIETGKSDVVNNVLKSLGSNSNLIVVLAIDVQALRLVRAQFNSKMDMERVFLIDSQNVDSLLSALPLKEWGHRDKHRPL